MLTFNYLRLIPKALREALYWKLAEELHAIDETDVAVFAARVLAAARRLLSL